MIMRLSLTGCFVALAVLMGATAQAATLNGIEGTVLVNRGSGWHVSATEATELEPGDSVVANPGGRGQIIYEDGCTVTVEEGNVVLVGEQSPCVEQASADGGGLLGTGGLFIIVPVVGAIVGLVFLLKGDDEPPASP